VEGVADSILYLMLLKLFVELFPYVHTFLLPALKEMIHCSFCLTAGWAKVLS